MPLCVKGTDVYARVQCVDTYPEKGLNENKKISINKDCIDTLCICGWGTITWARVRVYGHVCVYTWACRRNCGVGYSQNIVAIA